MYILGISAYYHDSAAAIIKDGKVLCAIEEERFSRIKHDNNFPLTSIEWCLKNLSLSMGDIEYVAYYEKPLLKFERILETWVTTYPFSLRPFVKGLPEWLDYKIKIEHTIRKKLQYKGKIFFIPHHVSHSSASFYPSPFKKAAILTVDGVGEYQTTGLWLGQENNIKPLKEVNFPHSLGLLYSTFTAFLGFKVNEDEYKVMGLAAYGKPSYKDKIYQIIDVKDDGSFQLNLKYFSFREDFTMWNKKFEGLFGSARKPGEQIVKRHKDLAASIQAVTEEIYFKILNYLYKLTKVENLCISGGVGLNALANGKIYSNTPFTKVYILGAAGDSGNAIGAALFAYHAILKKRERVKIDNLYFGSEWKSNQIEEELTKRKLKFKRFTNEEELIQAIARLLAEEEIIGWFQGKMEFGPRALGSRSILARPWPRNMKDRVNEVKRREQFRPFAGSILKEYVEHSFEIPKTQKDFPFMNFCFQMRKEMREKLAAIVHEDGTCRIQTVSKEDGLYYKLIKEFYRITGIPCILNTSFNLKGEPIVETPEDAIEDLLRTGIDFLAAGNFLVRKS